MPLPHTHPGPRAGVVFSLGLGVPSCTGTVGLEPRDPPSLWAGEESVQKVSLDLW